MHYFKNPHGEIRNQRLARIAASIKVPRHYVNVVWQEMLNYASQNTPRGNLEGIEREFEDIAYSQEIDIEIVSRIVTQILRDAVTCENCHILDWEKKYGTGSKVAPEKVREQNKIRKQKQREREKLLKEQDLEEGVTDVTPVTHSHAMSRSSRSSHHVTVHREKDISSAKEEKNIKTPLPSLENVDNLEQVIEFPRKIEEKPVDNIVNKSSNVLEYMEKIEDIRNQIRQEAIKPPPDPLEGLDFENENDFCAACAFALKRGLNPASLDGEETEIAAEWYRIYDPKSAFEIIYIAAKDQFRRHGKMPNSLKWFNERLIDRKCKRRHELKPPELKITTYV